MIIEITTACVVVVSLLIDGLIKTAKIIYDYKQNQKGEKKLNIFKSNCCNKGNLVDETNQD